ncbi:hypothetical protein [Duganella violaceipulchra]|uniref:Peptidoglycan-binding domain-containing protein n=1 Tax=Duganella violaceipulchra TaxID=2849652 RepID=A0AA41HB28_9BURK|nr:hypothetical protein [Duganella violaceicalia]MBV6325267.1 hypothetical protein [Duganella violaceicalia]MCP2012480.1 hypothetical protein [Duganella violaceicalia]
MGSSSTRDLAGTFRHAVEDYIYAMTDAGIDVSIDATYRPVKRSYLMHWSWRIVNDGLDASRIPTLAGVDIEWEHPTKAESIKSASDMVAALSIRRLRTRPALRSQHNFGLAIDMAISWNGTVFVKDARGTLVRIDTMPRTGMNRQLIAVAASDGVKKDYGGNKDVPLWSNNGR